MTKDFRARIIDGDGSSSFFEIDQSRIFSGYLTGISYNLPFLFLTDTWLNGGKLSERNCYCVLCDINLTIEKKEYKT